MNNLNERRERFMLDPLPIRLGGLAANLARVSSISNNPANFEAAFGLMEESKHFIEWTAAESQIETAAELVDLQVKLALWQRTLAIDWMNDEARQGIGRDAKKFSNAVLRKSGLLDAK